MTKGTNSVGDRWLPLDRLIGRPVLDRDGQSAGRIQELRVETRNGEWIVVEYVLGAAGLLERLNVGVRLLFGSRTKRRTAPAQHVDVSAPDALRLTCRRDDLQQA